MEFPLIAFATLVSAMIVAGAFTGLAASERAREDLTARWRAWSDRHAWRFEAQRGARNELPLPRVVATLDGAVVTVELRDRGPSRVVHLAARAPAASPALVLCDRALAPPGGLSRCDLDDRAFAARLALYAADEAHALAWCAPSLRHALLRFVGSAILDGLCLAVDAREITLSWPAVDPPLARVDEAVRIVASLAARAGAAYR